MTIPRDLSQATEEHLSALIQSQAAEGTFLDLKRELPSRDASGRHEFLADVSAFANSSGGDLVYGIDEDGEGRALRVVPQPGNADQEALRLQDVLMNGIEPRIPGLQVRAIAVEGGFVLVIRVPQSWAGPHRVTSNQHFFIRESGRKRQLNVPEIRGLFLRSEQQAQQVRNFRTDRLGRILAGDASHRLVPGAIFLAHFAPTQAVLGDLQIDPIPFMEVRRLPVLGASAPGARVNVDGALAVRNPRPEGTHGYSLMFRNGFFETVTVLPYSSAQRTPLRAMEANLIILVQKLREEYQHIGIGSEMTCMLSMHEANHMQLGLDRSVWCLDDHQGLFDRQTLVLPDVLLRAELSPQEAMQPVFDLMWQAAGMASAPRFNEQGDWVESPRRGY